MPVGVGLELGTDSIKAVKVRVTPNGVSILSAARLKRQPDGTFPTEGLADALRRAGIPRRGTIGVAGKDLMLRYMQVPPVPPWRLKMLVEFDVRENMASCTDVTSGYRPLNVSTGLEGGLLVLVAVAKTAYLEELFSLVRSAGFSVRSAVPCAVALYRGFVASRDFKPGETTFLLDIGRENLEMAIQRDGEILFARNATGSGGDRITRGIDGAFGIGWERAEAYKRERARLELGPPPDADRRQQLIYGELREAADSIVAAISSGLRFARLQTKQPNLDFDRLVLSGGGSRLAGLKEFLENRLQKPVGFYDPAAALDCSELGGSRLDQFGGAPTDMAVATGLAIIDAQEEGFSLPLLPPREVRRREFWRSRVFGYAAGVCAFVLAGAMFVRGRIELADALEQRQQLNRDVETMEKRVKAVRALESANRSDYEKLSLMLDELRINRALLKLLPLQRSSCPEGLKFSRMEVRAGQGLTATAEFEGRASGLDGQALLDKLGQLRAALSADPDVKVEEIGETASKPAGPEFAQAFRCRLSVSPWRTKELAP